MSKYVLALALLMASPSLAVQVDDKTAVAIARPKELIVAGGTSPAQLRKILAPVDAFYGFWNSGSASLLDRALSNGFVDHTLPPGRPQGPTGPMTASNAFLEAVPDLRCEVVQRLVIGDRVVSHLRFTGHFSGTLNGKAGTGQTVDFIATDILRVRGGKVTDNWHLEDNLTFLRQIGMVPNG